MGSVFGGYRPVWGLTSTTVARVEPGGYDTKTPQGGWALGCRFHSLVGV